MMAGGENDEGTDRAGNVEFAIVAAVAANGVIGADGGMPWHYPADLRRFRRLTTGHPLLMGRVTYESIAADLGGPLPDRRNIVLSRTAPEFPGPVTVVRGVDEAIEAARRAADGMDVDTAYVIGGASVYEAFLPYSDRLELTEIDREYPGDTEFPDWDRSAWREVGREDDGELSFVTYVRE